jgi:hypothetical protein
VQHGLGAVLGLDDHVGVRHRAVDIAALVAACLLEHGAPAHRLLGIEQRLELLELKLDQRESLACARVAVGGDRGDGRAVEARLGLQHVAVVRPDRAEDARKLERTAQVELLHARVRGRRAQDGRVQHPGQPEVGGVLRLAARPLVAVLPRRGLPDDVARPLRPLVDGVVALDHDPLLGVPALDFLLGPDQPCHVRTASSIRGYAPQRQRLPAMA